VRYKAEHDGLSPGIQTLCDALECRSTNTVEYYLQIVEKAGLIQRLGKRHGIKITGGAWVAPYPLPIFDDRVLHMVYRYVVRYKTEHDGLAPPETLIRYQSNAHILSLREARDVIKTLVVRSMFVLNGNGIQVVGGRWVPPAHSGSSVERTLSGLAE
jgi:hypothetical protein